MSDINTILAYIRQRRSNHLLIAGSAGSGKTRLARAIANDPELSSRVIFVAQHYHFTNRSHVNQFYYQQRFNSIDADDSATVAEELDKIGLPSTARTRLLQVFGMEGRQDAPLLHLSSGEHKRFQLVKAFLQQPGILVLDEPFTGMDARSRSLLRALMAQLAAGGTQIILVCSKADCPDFIELTHHLDANPGGAAHFEVPEHIEPLPFLADTLVKLDNTTIRYGEMTLFADLSWAVSTGERWWLKGENGSGKSTLISLLTGDNPKAYANHLELFGKKRGSGESIWDIKKNIGFVSPELQWYFDNSMSVFATIASGLFDTIGLFRKLNEEQDGIVRQWLNAFGLTHLQDKSLSQLSNSQQRLALLARAMVKNPALLILDEPCQGLDDQQIDNFRNIVDALCEDPNRTLIYVTHYDNELPRCINKSILLHNQQATLKAYHSTLIPA
ncbi:ATP-binding cassette domain-containing protein [Flavihumibacter fluvii]|uniref:ATP-binding cassette domain-containing protein n=1 Tax=Flavihumibacter fluvii TaxID=2838157 RepID=UPI001BDEEDDA|nr:ATP-binding cassette domain-containing protein [Flavihumibacter fluvii]ULQ54746.1 ATP-binding cassette domain-containing protein [Flavihumibacter fluvii]